MIPPVQHDVLRFQVSVDDPILVEVVQRQQHLANYIKHKMAILLPLISVLNPDPIRSGFNGVPGSVYNRVKITNKNRKKVDKLNFLSAGCSLFEG
jgi:hypothetical protein